MQPSVLLRNTEKVEEPVRQENLTRRYTEEAAAFIERSRGGPFFLYLAHSMPHIPLHASTDFRGKSPAGLYGDAVEEIDWSVGVLLSTIRRLDLDRETLVVFSSDNGPWYQGSPGPLRGRKGWTHEGGVRVPGIFRWPGRIAPGRVSDMPACTLDFFPTAAAIAGHTGTASALPPDGINILPFLAGEQKSLPDRLFLFFDTVFLQTARFGRWKIHVSRWRVPRYTPGYSGETNNTLRNPELYDVSVDPGESYNLAPDQPQIVRDLQLRISDALRTFPEEIRTSNSGLVRP
jgi:arylsulfatase A-like enzyme